MHRSFSAGRAWTPNNGWSRADTNLLEIGIVPTRAKSWTATKRLPFSLVGEYDRRRIQFGERGKWVERNAEPAHQTPAVCRITSWIHCVIYGAQQTDHSHHLPAGCEAAADWTGTVSRGARQSARAGWKGTKTMTGRLFGANRHRHAEWRTTLNSGEAAEEGGPRTYLRRSE